MHPENHCYSLGEGKSDFFRDQTAYLGYHVLMYETYGDGMTQHSGEYLVTRSYFDDFCLSFADYICNEYVKSENKETLHGYCVDAQNIGIDVFDFLMSIKHKEGKRQWFSIHQKKVTTKSEKQYDTRWKEVPSFADGTIGNAVSLLFYATNNHGDGIISRGALEIYWTLKEFERLTSGCVYDWGVWEEWLNELPRHHTGAFLAMREALQSVWNMESALSQIDCTKNNMMNARKAVVEEAKAL